jgi:hypothetical protein
MKKEEALKILGKSKPGKKIIAAWKAGKVALSKLVYYAKNPPKIRLFDDPRLMTKTAKEIEDMEKMELKPYAPYEGLASDTAKGKKMRDALMKKALNAKKKQDAKLKKAVTDRAKRSIGKNGGNGHPPTNKKSTSRTRTKKILKPRTRGNDLNIFAAGAGTGAGLTAGGLNALNNKIRNDAKKREAYAKAKTKSKKYKSKSHMYPPPKPKGLKKSKSHMSPPQKRKKRGGV